ncbi:MAG: bifunctional riboflavin kinase/FAD synthetase, partial [Deltaproteobacteria bacterium]|nr:bifunctional riboflavin kinase/FAD synthetase [Deltaproteobacteria bacterium]
MRILATSRNLAPQSGPFVMGIGMFDGVHRGHQAILARVRELARESGVQGLAYTFDPHPLHILNPLVAPPLIEPLEARIERFGALGIDAVLIERFDKAYAATTAERFIADVLVNKLNVRHVVVGAGFAFGAGQQGSPQTLAKAGVQHAFSAHVIEPVRAGDVEVSSTRVRELVRAGDMRAAAELLG